MRFLVPCEPVNDSWVRPLQGVVAAVAGEFRYRFFAVDDFMLMGGLHRGPRPRLILYKHVYTRRYLNLDDAGHAYRFVPPRNTSKGPGRYVLHRGLHAALDELDLWELPWMKPGLEAYREEHSWEDRWDLHPDLVEHGWCNGKEDD
jgi:hypothetical protein